MPTKININMHTAQVSLSMRDPPPKVRTLSLLQIMNTYLEGNSLTTDQVEVLIKNAKPKIGKGPWYRFLACSAKTKIGTTINLKPRKIMSVSGDLNAAIYAGSSFNHDDGDLARGFALVEIGPLSVLYSHLQLIKIVEDSRENTQRSNTNSSLRRLGKEFETLVTLDTATPSKVLRVFDARWPSDKKAQWDKLAHK